EPVDREAGIVRGRWARLGEPPENQQSEEGADPAEEDRELEGDDDEWWNRYRVLTAGHQLPPEGGPDRQEERDARAGQSTHHRDEADLGERTNLLHLRLDLLYGHRCVHPELGEALRPELADRLNRRVRVREDAEHVDRGHASAALRGHA